MTSANTTQMHTYITGHANKTVFRKAFRIIWMQSDRMCAIQIAHLLKVSTMRMLKHPVAATMLVGIMTIGSMGCSMAGADDGGNQAFFDLTGPGSARGTIGTATTDQNPATTNAAANAQPNASISRSGVAQERSSRSYVSGTRIGRNHYANRLHGHHMSVARHQYAHPTFTAEHHPASRGGMHAMQRMLENRGGQS